MTLTQSVADNPSSDSHVDITPYLTHHLKKSQNSTMFKFEEKQEFIEETRKP